MKYHKLKTLSFINNFFSSKELFKIPKKQQVEERKRIEKELGKDMYYTSSLICPAFPLLYRYLTVCLMESDLFLFYLTGMPKDKDLEILEMIQDKSKQRGENLSIIIHNHHDWCVRVIEEKLLSSAFICFLFLSFLHVAAGWDTGIRKRKRAPPPPPPSMEDEDR